MPVACEQALKWDVGRREKSGFALGSLRSALHSLHPMPHFGNLFTGRMNDNLIYVIHGFKKYQSYNRKEIKILHNWFTYSVALWEY